MEGDRSEKVIEGEENLCGSNVLWCSHGSCLMRLSDVVQVLDHVGEGYGVVWLCAKDPTIVNSDGGCQGV